MSSLRGRLAREEGLSLTVAICSLALMLAIGAVAMSQAVHALRQADEQDNVKRSLQAADAAIDAAVFRVARDGEILPL